MGGKNESIAKTFPSAYWEQSCMFPFPEISGRNFLALKGRSGKAVEMETEKQRA